MNISGSRVYRVVIASILFLVIVTSASGTSIAKVTVIDLFRQADLVAVIEVLSGDTEHYPVTVYKAKVKKAFKGTRPGETIYFGPFISYGVGSEYLVFLSKDEKGIEPKDKSSGVNYGVIPSFFRIMYVGFSIMPIEYACVFDGKEISQHCDYAIKLNPEQIILPASIKTFPHEDVGAITNYEKWVRRDGFLDFLRLMK